MDVVDMGRQTGGTNKSGEDNKAKQWGHQSWEMDGGRERQRQKKQGSGRQGEEKRRGRGIERRGGRKREKEKRRRWNEKGGKRKCGIKSLKKVGEKQCVSAWGTKKRGGGELRDIQREGKIECLPPLSLTLKLRAALDSGGMLKYTVLSFPPSSLSIARNTCTTWNTEIERAEESGWGEGLIVCVCVMGETLTRRVLLATNH